MKGLILALAALVLIACEDPSRAADVVWGKQACAHCAMLLSEPRFGAQLTTDAGDRFFFDDPGCMAAFIHQRAPHVRAMWVHLGAGSRGGWVDATSARFEAAQSPMDYGFAPSQTGAFDWAAVVRKAIAREGAS